MKRETIEKLLKDNGVSEEKVKTVVDSIMADNGRDIEAEKAKTTSKDEELKTANETIKTLKETVSKFDGVDIDKLKTSVADWEKKYNEDIAAEKAKLTNVIRSGALKESLTAAGVIDADYLIYKHGGIEKFAFSEDKPIGIEDILKPYKESSPHLFKTEEGSGSGGAGTGFKGGTGGNHGGGGGVDYDAMSDADYYAEVLKKE